MLYAHTLHSICIFTMFHAFRCVFICWKLCAARLGLGLNPWCNFFCMSYAHAHFKCTYPLSSLYFGTLLWWCFFVCLSLSLSLSLSNRLRMHLSANLLQSRILFIPNHLLLILLFFTSDSMMRRPIKTSRITSPNVVFIRNTTWFYQTFPILLYPLSFTVEDGQIYVRYPWVVPLWSYKSSTLTRTVLIPLYLGLLCRFEVHVL